MKTGRIRLIPISAANWQDCIALRLTPQQEKFLPSNLYSIAEAQFYPEAKSLAIYASSNQLVGYCLLGREERTGKWRIFRFMIDQAFQNMGYGQSALKEIINLLSEEPGGQEILVSYQESNQVARALYAKLGFVELESWDADQVTATLIRSEH